MPVRQKVGRGRRSVASGLSGRTLTTAVAAAGFGLALFGVLMSIYPIVDFNIKGIAERRIPVFEAGDEEPPVNHSQDHTPRPVLLLPTPTETPPLELPEMATDPLASEAVEFALQNPFAEATRLTPEPVVPAAKSPWFEAPPPENTPALSQEPAPSQEDPTQSPEEPYVDEPLLPVPPQTAPSDMSTNTQETSAHPPQPPPDLATDTGTSPQPLPSDLPADAATAHQTPASPSETSSPSDLPAGLSPLAEEAEYYLE